MSNQSEQKRAEEKRRAHVEDLPQREEALPDDEAKGVKGGGGARGGVVGNRMPIGEEIPQ